MDAGPLVLEFVGGPEDGATFDCDPLKFDFGTPIEIYRDHEVYRSLVNWNGVARYVKLYHRGRAKGVGQ